MEFRHLRYFVAVAEELSFTKAARKLRLAQPSLTRQVQNLEDEIGVRLLERAKNRVVLTEEGRRFLFDSKKLLAMCAESVIAVQRMNLGESSQLNIGYMANIHYGMLPATFGAFRKLYPRVGLNLFDMTSAKQFEALEGRKIDLGFVGLTIIRCKDLHRFARKSSMTVVIDREKSARLARCAWHWNGIRCHPFPSRCHKLPPPLPDRTRATGVGAGTGASGVCQALRSGSGNHTALQVSNFPYRRVRYDRNSQGNLYAALLHPCNHETSRWCN
jgi:DNA-binding transcriptional LysR family regulator